MKGGKCFEVLFRIIYQVLYYCFPKKQKFAVAAKESRIMTISKYSQMKYTIKKADRAEVQIMTDWAAGEGWNPGFDDAESFYNTDPNGFFIGYLGDEPISCISAVSYGNEYSFIGFYIVKEAYRGKGYGIQIWNHAMKHLSSNQNIGLDGVVAQQENYKKSGFVLAYQNIRFEYIVPAGKKEYRNKNIIPISNEIPVSVFDYDLKIFGHKRTSFLKSWLTQLNGITLQYIDNQPVKSIGVIRKCGIGYKIGPLYCEDENIAEAMFLALLNYVKEGEKVYLDVPEINQKAVQLAEKYDMQKSFETARMYTNLTREYPVNKVFGVSTFELG